jgi:hypothetical protein
MSTLRIVQYFTLKAYASDFNWLEPENSGSNKNKVYRHYYQNFFVNETKRWNNENYQFAPFRVEGTSSALGGDNPMAQVLFPNVEYAIRLVEQGNGNRLSKLIITTAWLNEALQPDARVYQERYIGLGAAFSETTIELRFRSAMDSVSGRFPARTFSRNNVGLLPLSADLSFR